MSLPTPAPDMEEAIEAAREIVAADEDPRFQHADVGDVEGAWDRLDNALYQHGRRVARALLSLKEEWRPPNETDKTRSDLIGRWSSESSVRWKPYKAGAPAWAVKLGGRWQALTNVYGHWENCEAPSLVRSLPSPPKD
jgi:hypothetical protein